MSDEAVEALKQVSVRIADLPDLVLGWRYGSTIWVDMDAAGHGWFVDPTPRTDSEFRISRHSGELRATPASPAFGRMDLLTVISHEMGHVLGFGDFNPHGGGHTLMDETLETGTRRVIAEGGRANGRADDFFGKIHHARESGDAHSGSNGHADPRVRWDSAYVPLSRGSFTSDFSSSGSAQNSHARENGTNPLPYRGLGDLFTSRFKSALSSTPWLRNFVVDLPEDEEEKDPYSDLVVTLEK